MTAGRTLFRYPRARRAHIPGRRGRSEAGANPALSRNCDASWVGRLGVETTQRGRARSPALADELSPRRKGGSSGAAAGPPPSAQRGGFSMKRHWFAGAAVLALLVLAAPAAARH